MLAAGTVLPRVQASQTGGFTFAALNDLHHVAEECDAWFVQRFAEVQHHQPELILLLGDLAHRGALTDLQAMRRLTGNLNVPCYPVPGNHDNDLPLDTSLYRQVFPGRLNYRVDHGGWTFLGLDTTDGNAWKDTVVAADTLAWLDAELPKLDRRRPLVVFTHFPLARGLTTVHGHMMTPRNAEALLDRLVGFNVRTVFSGHFHGISEREYRGLPLVTGACCSRVEKNHDGTTVKGWWLCRAEPDGQLTRTFQPLPLDA